jgi:hypothetical protein
MIRTGKPRENSHQSDCCAKNSCFSQPGHRPKVNSSPIKIFFSIQKAGAFRIWFLSDAGKPRRLDSMHAFESRFRVWGLQQVKSAFDGFKGRFGVCLVAFIRRAVQVGN